MIVPTRLSAQTGRVKQATLLVVVIAAGGLLPSCRSAASRAGDAQLWPRDLYEITISGRRVGSLLAVPVTIKGAETSWWVVDTGAVPNGLLVDRVESLRLPLATEANGGESRTRNHLGTVPLGIHWVEWIDVGGIAMARHPILALPRGLFQGECMKGVDGMLGQYFLRRTTMTIDTRAASLTLHRSEDFVPSGATEVPVVMREFIPIVKGRLSDGTEIELMLDTGSGTPLTLHSRFSHLVEDSGNMLPSSSVTGRTEHRSGTLPFIDVLQRRFTDVPVVLFEPTPGEEASLVDGLVGLPLIDGLEITLSSRQARLWVRDAPPAR